MASQEQVKKGFDFIRHSFNSVGTFRLAELEIVIEHADENENSLADHRGYIIDRVASGYKFDYLLNLAYTIASQAQEENLNVEVVSNEPKLTEAEKDAWENFGARDDDFIPPLLLIVKSHYSDEYLERIANTQGLF